MPPKRERPDRSWLEEKYVAEHRGLSEIGTLIGASKAFVLRCLIEYGIPRTHKVRQKGRPQPFCACGCGKRLQEPPLRNYGTRYLPGHSNHDPAILRKIGAESSARQRGQKKPESQIERQRRALLIRYGSDPNKPKNEARNARDNASYSAWRSAVYERDNYTCQACGERGARLNAHHKLPFAKYPELRYSVENGITLCQRCHRAAHRRKEVA